MEDKLRAYMDHLFRNVSPSRKSVELKEEILQNLADKYHDLLAEGKTQEAAYNIAVASIGDMDELLAGLDKEQNRGSVMSSEQIEHNRKKSAICISVAVMLYILSVLPPILLAGGRFGETLAPALMFVFIAAATCLLLYNCISRPRHSRREDTIIGEFREWQHRTEADRNAYGAISGAVWCLVIVVYIITSFWTMAWHITWVIFLIGVAVNRIIRAIFDLRK